jgi:hypothetical protein
MKDCFGILYAFLILGYVLSLATDIEEKPSLHTICIISHRDTSHLLLVGNVPQFSFSSISESL